MSGLEGPAVGLGARVAIAAATHFFRTSEFDRLCARLAERFEDRVPYTASDYAGWAVNDAFAAALGKYVRPPHEFDREALVAAITPLVGSLDSETPAEAFAGMVADAIYEELRLAKEGDALVRFEADRVIEAVEGIAEARPGVLGGLDLTWAPVRAESALRRVAENSVDAARRLEQALKGRNLPAELPGLIEDPPGWLREAGPDSWRFLARVAEILGLWRAAQRSYEKMAERPGADRARALMGASGAAGYAGDAEASAALHERARCIQPDHPVVRLVEISKEEDPPTRLALLDELGEPTEDEHRGLALAVRALALLNAGRVDDAEPLARVAVEAAPETAAVREAPLAVTLARNRALHTAGRATQRRELLQAAEEYRRLRDELREAGRFDESAGMLQRVAECQTLADRPDLARLTLAEVRNEELAAQEVTLLLAEAALNAGDPELAEEILGHYTGDDPAAELMRAQTMLRDPDRRPEGVAILDGRVANGDELAARLRLMAGVPWTGDVPWSDAAEALVREHEPVLASFLKAEWYDRAARPDESRRELARHANDPRALEELMGHFAEREEWEKAAAPARALLRAGPGLRVCIGAAQVLQRAGETAEAEGVLRKTLADPDIHDEEYTVAFNELTNHLLRAGRHADARDVAENALERGEPGAGWVIAYTFAREGDVESARAQIEGLEPRGLGDIQLAAEMRFVVDPPVDALRGIVELADGLPERNEQVELLASLALVRTREEHEVPPELVARASPERFVERFPDSTALRQVEFDDDAALLELISGLAERCWRAASEAEAHVLEAGDWPVGGLAEVVGDTLAEVWAKLPRLPLAYPVAPLDEEVRVAGDAAGGPVVVETGALYSLQLLGSDITEAVLAEFPLSEKAQATLDDLIRAVTIDLSAGEETAKQIGWDPEAGKPLAIEISAEEAHAPRRAAEAMQRVAARLDTAATPARVDQLDDEQSDQVSTVARAYAETVDAARRVRAPVYADDRYFRRLLTENDVPCFGTVALLRSLQESDAIPREAYLAALARLRERRSIGLPPQA